MSADQVYSGVLDEGAPELIAAVERGAASVSLAEQIAQLPKDEQRRIVASCDKRTIIAACHEVRKADTERNRAARLANRREPRFHGHRRARHFRAGPLPKDPHRDWEKSTR
jgi:hypothetical protein